jgi:uncharacterized protein YndB with AHSA1/START domain
MATGTLKVTLPNDREILMTRVFDAPRKLVFEALTRPELLKQWFFGPPGWMLAVCDVDLRVGGAYRYVWRKADGREMGMGGTFREIVRPERLVTTETFDQPWYPGDAVSTLVLTERGGRTTLTVNVRYDSKEVRDGVLEYPMTDGVEAGYDRLAGWLASAEARALETAQ